MSKRQFVELDEVSLELLLKQVHQWRIKVLAACATSGENIRRRIVLLLEVVKRQQEWATLLLGRVAKLQNGVANDRNSDIEQISECEQTLRALMQASSVHDQNGDQGLIQILGRMEMIRDLMTRLVTSSDTESLTLKLHKHGEMLERIQEGMRTIKL